MDLVIGTRMHSNIFSTSRGVPVIPIGYLHKSLGIAQTVGLAEWVIDIEKADAEILTDKLGAIWNQRYEIRAYLEQTIPTVIEESQKAGQLIAQDYFGLTRKD
jgi:colanic acid/amylovoran biosynthesis protein